ncbi:MAG: tryptophan--tRNA ligase [Parcubacteria group bacterium]|jgi:tryptophanyl-tRNA synthetase|nr:tryptophan--tRNA ligase [Parcubacteria group bacterium]|tara:strand:+ start:3173 stop:4156 length:984 start_codon:yes stop_codon:yes gene_type:complete
MKKRIFSGIRPTGPLHIGNYLGAIKNWLQLQNEYDSVFCIVDLHALTTPNASKGLKKKVFDLATTYLAAGLNPKKCILFVQSQVPEHTELTWLLNTVTPIAELERMTQFKDKAKEHRSNVNMGLFDYPVLMAADILIYQTDLVPVGEDQRQHVEMARTIARKFNQTYGATFKVPEVLIREQGAKILALDNPLKKMSKSSPNLYSRINLTDSPDEIQEKIKRAITDSGKEITYNPQKPALANLITIYSAFSKLSASQIEKKYQGKGYAQFKTDLANVIIKALKPFQAKKKALEQEPEQVKKILEQSAKQAQAIARKNLKEAKQKMGLI